LLPQTIYYVLCALIMLLKTYRPIQLFVKLSFIFFLFVYHFSGV